MKCAQGALVALVCLLPPLASAGAGEPAAIGVLGDSYSDEYQFYGPDRSTGRNWVEMLAASRGLDFGRFANDSRGEPRLQGYEFNWARSDATTGDLLESGQHTGLAAQVASGAVRYVVIFIGGNDFIHALDSSEPVTALERALPRALRNYRVALETILRASPEVKVVAVTVPDISVLPRFQDRIRSGELPASVVARYAAALKQYNAQIRRLGLEHPRIAVADFDLTARVANRVSRRYAFIAGRRLDRVRGQNDAEHLFLADQRHLGTIGQGLMAQLVVNALDVKYAAGIAPLSDRDITLFARSVAPSPGPRQALAKLGSGAAQADRPGPERGEPLP